MASWDSLRSFIKSNYVIGLDELEIIGLDFRLDDGRTQKVIVRRLTLGDEEWAEISTPICGEDSLDPRAALLRNGEMVVGGLAMMDDGMIYFRHALPLRSLDLSEFEVPFHLAVKFGDQLEREIVGLDRY